MSRGEEGGERTYGDNGLVLGSTLLRQPLAEATKSDASSLLDHRLGILKTSLDDGPKLSDVRSNELGATLKERRRRARGSDLSFEEKPGTDQNEA